MSDTGQNLVLWTNTARNHIRFYLLCSLIALTIQFIDHAVGPMLLVNILLHLHCFIIVGLVIWHAWRRGNDVQNGFEVVDLRLILIDVLFLLAGVVGIYWIVGIAYILNQKFSSFQNHSLDEIIDDNILTSMAYGQIHVLNFTGKLNLLVDLVCSLKLWSIVSKGSSKLWYKIRSRPLVRAVLLSLLSRQNRNAFSNEDPISPTPVSGNADADVPPQPSRSRDINANYANASLQPSHSSNMNVNNVDPPSPSPSQSNSSDDNNDADPTPPSPPPPNNVDASNATNDNQVKRFETLSRPSAIKQFLFYLYLSLTIFYFAICEHISFGFLQTFLVFFLIMYILKLQSGSGAREAIENKPEDYKALYTADLLICVTCIVTLFYVIAGGFVCVLILVWPYLDQIKEPNLFEEHIKTVLKQDFPTLSGIIGVCAALPVLDVVVILPIALISLIYHASRL